MKIFIFRLCLEEAFKLGKCLFIDIRQSTDLFLEQVQLMPAFLFSKNLILKKKAEYFLKRGNVIVNVLLSNIFVLSDILEDISKEL